MDYFKILESKSVTLLIYYIDLLCEISWCECFWEQIWNMISLNISEFGLCWNNFKVAELSENLSAHAAWVNEVIFHITCDKNCDKISVSAWNCVWNCCSLCADAAWVWAVFDVNAVEDCSIFAEESCRNCELWVWGVGVDLVLLGWLEKSLDICVTCVVRH